MGLDDDADEIEQIPSTINFNAIYNKLPEIVGK